MENSLLGGAGEVTGDGDLDQGSSCGVGEEQTHPESALPGESAGCHGVGVRAGTKAGARAEARAPGSGGVLLPEMDKTGGGIDRKSVV